MEAYRLKLTWTFKMELVIIYISVTLSRNIINPASPSVVYHRPIENVLKLSAQATKKKELKRWATLV